MSVAPSPLPATAAPEYDTETPLPRQSVLCSVKNPPSTASDNACEDRA